MSSGKPTMILSMNSGATAIVTQTDIPGLVNVQVTTGEAFYDLTLGQLQYLAMKNGWTVVPAKQDGEP